MLTVGNHYGGGRPVVVEHLRLVKRIVPEELFCPEAFIKVE